LPQLLQDRRVLEGRDVLRDLLALGDRAQQAPHDLAGARLGQVVAKTDVLRLGDRADLLADPVAQLLRDLQRFVPGGYRTLQHHEGTHRLAGELIGPADDRRLGDKTRVRHQRRFDLHRAEAMTRHVQYVIDATDDAEIPLLVRARAVT